MTALKLQNASLVEYQVVVPIRWSDQDVNKHVNNATIVTLIEESRIQWLNKDAAKVGITTFDCPKVVVDLSVQYKLPVSAKSELSVKISTERIGNTSFVLRYRGVQAGEEVFQARTVLVVLDEETERPRVISFEERTYLSAYLVEGDSKS
ncbi:thioesterase [Corynebacterium glutamicum MT]|uniref:Thioesterase n=1 Tax=Corynebacterium glutamicum TaxID=1718 RepID=A0AB36ICA1_CORGT|nr:thioesterase family protein [Corynebacterium glutamicum]AGN20577.1 thioesterase [Corynebacterium glutamicum SCgG1]AGN23602.1 thioesterase [Corynebacterium glutamicum SCgG2]EGV41164.1 thioesterase [Corynebacterium glutamicum S9114]EOA64025.1 thioesterase [Corynebacterium glutamicum MT]EPP39293.1 thioesterase [Corynebacterium glutamicum Z188]